MSIIASELIPAPYRWLLWLAAVIIIAGAGAWGGHQATQAYYQPKIEKLETRAKAAEDRAAEFETAYNALASATQRQNDAINKLRADSAERQRLADIAIAKAKAESATFKSRAAATMSLKLPPGADECTAAMEEFDIELKEERGR
jgi:hypothetical protein